MDKVIKLMKQRLSHPKGYSRESLRINAYVKKQNTKLYTIRSLPSRNMNSQEQRLEGKGKLKTAVGFQRRGYSGIFFFP